MSKISDVGNTLIVSRFALTLSIGVCCVMSAGGSSSASASATSFWTRLNRDGPLSAGWVQVLPVLASACNFRIDTAKLNATLIGLSQTPGNIDYARDMYTVLDRIENRKAQNGFVNIWNARFRGDQSAACATAGRLWGNAGRQFPGILVEEASADTTGAISQSRPSNCQ